MSIFKTIESFFGKAETAVSTALADVQAGFKTVDNLAGVVLGEAQIAAGVILVVDPALGIQVEAGVTAMTALRATVEAAVSAGSSDAVALGKQVMQLFAMVGTLGAQVAPFIEVAGKQASAVDTAAVAAVKALPSIPATV